MSGLKSKQKGYRYEAKLRAMHLDIGIHAERVPLSGAAGGSYTGDLVIDGEFRAECKARANGQGFKVLEEWKRENDILFLFRDRKLPLVCMDWDVYARIMSPKVDI